MANVDAPHGFRIWGPCLRQRLYAVPTAPTIHLRVNQMVIEDVTNVVSAKLGLGIAVYDAAVLPATTGDDRLVLGVITACFDEDMDPIEYIDVGRVGDSTVAGYVLIADHPDQQFEAQADGEITDANMEYNYEVTSVALDAVASGSQTELSQQEIAISGAAITVTLPIRLVAQAYPDVDSHASAGCRWICQINPLCHRYGAGVTI